MGQVQHKIRNKIRQGQGTTNAIAKKYNIALYRKEMLRS